MFGLYSKTDDGGKSLSIKPTRFMSNSTHMLQRLAKECSRDHAHQHLLGGRAADAAFYPLPLLKAIIRGMADTKDAVDSVSSLSQNDWDVVLSLSLDSQCARS